VMLNLYVMPIVGTGDKRDPRRPKYVTSFQAFAWGMFDYGNEPWCLVGVADIDAATDSALTANPDCLGLPTNLDQNLTTQQRTRTSNALETANIPGTWIVAGTSWRGVTTFVGAVCQFAQRYQGGECGGQWFTGGVTLATTFGALPPSVQQCIQAAADSFGFDTSAMNAGTALRQILRSAGQQYVAANLPLIMAGISLYNSQPV
jgi:hypothetical protein